MTAGAWFEASPDASDPENDPLTFDIVNRPGWASFDTSTGLLSGTPSAADVGSYDGLRISVSDGINVTDGNVFRVVVEGDTAPPPANRPPVISGSPATQVLIGQSYAFEPTASDPDGQALRFTIAGRPAWASFDTASGRLSGTPGASTAGTYPNIRISVTDGEADAALPPFSITVSPPTPTNRPPLIGGMPAGLGREGIPYSFTPTASDPDGHALVFSIANRPAWASFNTGTGQLAGTPPAGSARDYPGISISVSDGNLSAALPVFSIGVAANRAPTIGGSPATTVSAGQAYSFTPSASDADGNDLSFTISNRPGWAAFSTSTGRLSGTPSQAQAGTYSNIQIRVTDGLATTSLASFQITVEAGNRAPTISGSPATTIVEGQAYSFQPSASDPDGDSLGFTIANRPSWATFNATTGRLSGTPGNGTVGSYPNIQIRVSDGSLQASLPAFSISVQQVANGSATLGWNPPTTREDGTPLTNLAGFRLRYGNSAGNYPNTITIDNPGVTTYVVENLASGTWYFVVAAFDSAGDQSANTSPLSKTIP